MKSLSYLFIVFVFIAIACSDNENAVPTPPAPDPFLSRKAISRIVVGTLNPDSVKIQLDTVAGTAFISVPFDVNYKAIELNVFHNGAFVSPTASSAQNFTNPVVYTVTAVSGTKKNYTITLTRRSQPEFKNVKFSTDIAGNSIRWGDTVKVYAQNLIVNLTDDNGKKIQNDVIFVNNTTQVETKVSAGVTRLINALDGYGSEGLKVVFPDDLPLAEYTVKLGAFTKTAVATSLAGTLNTKFPDAKPIDFPISLKEGDIIEIKGKYFTNIPRGTTTPPKVRLQKTSSLKIINGQEFEIIGFTETSITAKVKGFTDPDANIIMGTTYLSFYGNINGSWNVYTYKRVTFTP